MTNQALCQIYLVWLVCCMIYNYAVAKKGEKVGGLFYGFIFSIALPIIIALGIGALIALTCVVMIALGIN